ncbi:MAG: hypothetical protein DYG89_41910 [Caldilinea sp. CFX5]|nr:hypothetical protein [Caldilinea sp. CFX5]
MSLKISNWSKQLPLRPPFTPAGVVAGLLLLSFLLLFATPLLAQEGEPRAGQQAEVSDYLQNQLRTSQEPVSLLIVLREQLDSTAALGRANIRNANRQERAAFLYRELTTIAQRTQAPLRAWLTEQGIPYRAFYLVNMIEVQGDARLVAALQRRPEVARLIANPAINQELHRLPQAPRFTILGANVAQATPARPYGLDFTRAPAVWALGYQGQGIVIASQDTGVEWDHPALKNAYRGVITDTTTTTITHPYNWYDAWGVAGRPARCNSDAQVPCDDDGHGTHTVGTVLGDATVISDTVLGMAPAAEWIGCRNMKNGVGTPASYTDCFQFFLAPYPQGGNPMTDGRPELAPHIVNNSWGCPPSEGCDAGSLRQIVETVRTAGIMVVASAGNSGPLCGTVDDPIAIYDATFSVGAHNSNGLIAAFSSRGAVTVDGSGRRKPDLSAPGVGVRSAWVNKGFNTISGTSMASPHVAGAVALLWSAAPDLVGEIDLTEQVLIKSATPVPLNQCGEGNTPVAPNNTYGFGRLDVLAAVQLAQQPGAMTITVSDTTTVGVTVVLTDALTGYQYSATTGTDGIARFPRLYAGSYRATLAGVPANPSPIPLVANEQKQVTIQRADPTDIDEQPEPLRRLFLPFIVQPQ